MSEVNKYISQHKQSQCWDKLTELNMEIIEYKDFCDDAEKMVDFYKLSKEEFLESYSYITEQEYILTQLNGVKHGI